MGKKGPNKVKQELLQKGISDRLINQYMPVYEEEIQIEHATKLAKSGRSYEYKIRASLY